MCSCYSNMPFTGERYVRHINSRNRVRKPGSPEVPFHCFASQAGLRLCRFASVPLIQAHFSFMPHTTEKANGGTTE